MVQVIGFTRSIKIVLAELTRKEFPCETSFPAKRDLQVFRDPYEKAKYQYFIEHEKLGLKHYDDPKAFIEYSNYICKMFMKILKNTI